MSIVKKYKKLMGVISLDVALAAFQAYEVHKTFVRREEELKSQIQSIQDKQERLQYISPAGWSTFDYEAGTRAKKLHGLQKQYEEKLKLIDDIKKRQSDFSTQFQKKYNYDLFDVLTEISRWRDIASSNAPVSDNREIYLQYLQIRTQSKDEPIQFSINCWVFNEYEYLYKDHEMLHYTDEQIRLLILEDFDRERRYFEKLKAKFDDRQGLELSEKFERLRIPENVRVEVWRRDSGKCARCGSREKLEYDHIVPISKGGSNTARNIELLCEKCNRSKSNNVV